MTKNKIQRMTILAVFTALIIGLQWLGSFIRFGPFSISLVLVPLVIAAILEGPLAGAYLGGIFGLAVFLSGDAAAFLTVSVPGTVLTVMLKGILAGFAAGAVYKLLKNHNKYVAMIVAAVICPIVNTLVFILGCFAFFWGTLQEWGSSLGFTNTFVYLIVGMIGLNFLLELLVNLVFSPAIVRVIDIGKTKLLR